MNDGLTVFYLPRLDDAELSEALNWTLHTYDHAPRFCGWLTDELLNEMTRRLRMDRGDVLETNVLTLPFHRWSTRDVQQALTLATVLSYANVGYGVGQLVDALVQGIVAAAGARMNRLEETCPR